MTLSLSSVRAPSRLSSPSSFVAHAMGVWAERRELSRLDTSRLRDLGISPEAAAVEAARPMWDLPAQRR